MGALPGTVAALAAASAITRSPALSQITTDSGLVHSGAEYSGCAWSTYSRPPLVRMTLARPRSSSVSCEESAASRVRSKPRASRSGFSSSKSQRARRALAAVAAWYALTIWDEVTIALAPGWPGTEMPYSVSVPITRRTLISASLTGVRPSILHTGPAGAVRCAARGRQPGPWPPGPWPPAPRRAGAGTRWTGPVTAGQLEVLAGVGDGVDRPSGLGPVLAGDQRPDVDDPLALLAGDPRPVVRVGGVRQVLVLAELVHAGGQQVGDAQPLLPGLEELLDRHLLRPVHDVLDHGTGVEVLEVQDLLVPVGVGHLEEAVLLRLAVHPLDDTLDHRLHRGLGRTAVLGQVVGVQRQGGEDVLGE